MPEEAEFKLTDARVTLYVDHNFFNYRTGAVVSVFMYGVSFEYGGIWWPLEEQDGSVALYGCYASARRHVRRIHKKIKAKL